jgi:hypothetical protein
MATIQTDRGPMLVVVVGGGGGHRVKKGRGVLGRFLFGMGGGCGLVITCVNYR